MHILDRYLLNEFIRKFIGILCVLAFLLLLKEILGGIADVLSHEPPLLYVALYFFLRIPQEMVFVIPSSVLLAMMFSIGILSKNKEILAIHASGVSYLRIARPLILCIAVITFLAYIGIEVIVPYSMDKADYIEDVVFEEKDISVRTSNRNVTTKGAGNRFYGMESFDSSRMLMTLPSIKERTDDGRTLKMRLEAKSAQLVIAGPDKEWVPINKAKKGQQYYWQFKDADYLQFDDSGALTTRTFHASITLPMEENLDRFLIEPESDYMGLIDLYRQSNAEGLRGKTEHYYSLKTELHNRLAMPLATLLMGLLGYTFAVRASIRSLTMEFGFALLCIVGYYIMAAFFEKLGETGSTSPLVSAWITNVTFLVFLIVRFFRLERVPRV
jgi:lipopolysaccharide export system permease protein